MEVLIIGFVSALTITAGGVLAFIQLNRRVTRVETHVQHLETRLLPRGQSQSQQQSQANQRSYQQQVPEWHSVPIHSTVVYYPPQLPQQSQQPQASAPAYEDPAPRVI